MTKIEHTFDKLVTNMLALKRRSFADTLLSKVFNQLWVNVNEAKKLLNKLNYKRPKRALISVLGHAIKFITGNLDENDLQNINENLDRLYQNQNSELKQINKITSFANHLTRRYSDDLRTLSQSINETQLLLQNSQKSEEIKLLIENEIYQSLNLLNLLQMLERTISLSWSTTPNLELFNVKDLLEIHDYLGNIYRLSQLLPFDQIHLYKILEKAKLFVIGTNKAITFLLKFPILKPFAANYYRIYPVPNHQDVAIVPPRRYLLEFSNSSYWTDEDCAVFVNIILCQQQPTTEKCLLPDVRLCTTIKITNNYKVSHSLKNHQLMVLFKEAEEVIEDCQGELNRKWIAGANLLSSSCKIIIGTSVFYNVTPIFEIQPPNLVEETLQFTRGMKLHPRHLEDPTDLIEESEDLQEKPLHLQPLVHIVHYSISLFVILCLITIMILAIKYRSRIMELLCKPRKVIRIKWAPKSQNLNEDVQT